MSDAGKQSTPDHSVGSQAADPPGEGQVDASTSETDSFELESPTSIHPPLEPMDPQLTTVQPGGGVVIELELAWGNFRRWYLKTFRSGYVARMKELRQGDKNACPHEVLDPRDVKFFRNQNGYYWDEKDDPFTWRNQLPFVRDGLAELFVFIALFWGVAALIGWWTIAGGFQGIDRVVLGLIALTSFVIGGLIMWFFRNPNRPIPAGPGQVVAPADGKVVEIVEIDDDPFIKGPAIRIGIFLSIFNVHINRSPVVGQVIGLRYKPGKCLNALRPESARENEQLEVRIKEIDAPYRKMVIRQITGAIARRIVNGLKPGDKLTRGEVFGMIKLGSRTELLIPQEEGLKIITQLGDKIQAGSTVLAEYAD